MWTANHRTVIAICVFCLMGAGSALLAQGHRAIISGLVVDASGASVPGAEVRVIHQSTNIAHNTITSDSGYYEAPGLLPGQYRIEAALEGFKTAVVEDIPVASNERVRVDLSLDVGEVEDSVTVTSDPTLLQSADADLGVAFGQKPLTSLPIGQGNPTYLFLLSPSADSAAGYGNFSMNQEPYQRAGSGLVRFNGMPTGTAEFTMDGTPNTQRNNAVDGGAVSFNATTELVKEVRIQTTTFDASVGHTGSTTVDVIMKTGTNDYHGEAFYFGRHDMFNANSWVRNRAGQNRSSFPYKRYGFTGGGPVIKDKTFFFLGWTHWEQVRFGDSQATVPRAAHKSGDFSDLLALDPEYQLYDPMTAVLNAEGRVERQPFPNNIIPSSRIHPISAPLLGFFLAPNNSSGASSDGFRNYLYDKGYTPLPRTDRHTVLRIDHDLNDSHTLFGRYLNSDGPSSGWTMFDNHPGGPGCECVDVHGTRHQIWNFSVGDVWTINPTFVADFRATNNRHTSRARNNAGGLTWADLPTNMSQFVDVEFTGFPYVSITGYPKLSNLPGGHNGFTNFDPGLQVDEIRSASAHFTQISGNHSFRFGADWRGYVYNSVRSDQARTFFTGQFSSGPFDNSPPPPRGHGLADFLLGLHSSTNRNVRADYANYSTYTGIYLQDDWKVTPRLTVNLGLRWEREGPPTEMHDQALTRWAADVENPVSAAVQANYAKNPIPEIPVDQFRLMGGVLFAGVDGEPRTVYDSDNNNFSPRTGAAYRLNDNTVLKGGYSRTFIPLNQRHFAARFPIAGFDTSTFAFSSTDGGLTFPGSLDDLFPGGLNQPRGSSDGLMTNLGQLIWMNHGVDRSTTNPYAHQFQLGIQRRLSPNATVEVRYVGNRTRDFGISNNDHNRLPGQYLTRSIERDQAHIDYMTARVPNPFQGVEGVGGSLGVASTIQRQALLRPYPHISGLRSWADKVGSTDYNAMQIEFRAQDLGGWDVQSSYTWGKTMEELQFLNGFGIDPAPERTIGINDRPHVLRFAGTFSFPFGKGQRFGPNSGLASHLISGWSATFIGFAQSGIPMKWGNIIFRGNIKNIPVGQHEATRMFNQNAGFERSSAKQPAYNLRTFPLRLSGVRDQAPTDVGFTLVKNTFIGERFQAQFRLEAYNLLNSHYFWGGYRNAVNTNPRSSGFGTQGFSSGPRIVQFGVKFIF